MTESKMPKEALSRNIDTSSGVSFRQRQYFGTFIGLNVGDCLGAYCEKNTESHIRDFIIDLIQNKIPKESLPYTDDTSLSIAVAKSLVSERNLSPPSIARHICDAFHEEPLRGFARGAISIFANLDAVKYQGKLGQHCYRPAASVFDCTGSFANGAAMRAAPIGLFCNAKRATKNEMVLISILAAALTHTHRIGMLGGIQQAAAISLLLSTKDGKEKNREVFIDRLINIVQEVEFKGIMDYWKENSGSELANICPDTEYYCKYLHSYEKNERDVEYSKVLLKIKELYFDCKNGGVIDLSYFHQNVCDCSVSAIDSVPVALLAFMVALEPKCENEVNDKLGIDRSFMLLKPIERVIFYAIALGGDMDTIGSMAGALAGAYLGFSDENLSATIVDACEGIEKSKQFAYSMYICFK